MKEELKEAGRSDSEKRGFPGSRQAPPSPQGPHKAVIWSDIEEGKKTYKVIVGSLDSKEAAAQYKTNVQKKTGIKGFVVALENK